MSPKRRVTVRRYPAVRLPGNTPKARRRPAKWGLAGLTAGLAGGALLGALFTNSATSDPSMLAHSGAAAAPSAQHAEQAPEEKRERPDYNVPSVEDVDEEFVDSEDSLDVSEYPETDGEPVPQDVIAQPLPPTNQLLEPPAPVSQAVASADTLTKNLTKNVGETVGFVEDLVDNLPNIVPDINKPDTRKDDVPPRSDAEENLEPVGEVINLLRQTNPVEDTPEDTPAETLRRDGEPCITPNPPPGMSAPAVCLPMGDITPEPAPQPREAPTNRTVEPIGNTIEPTVDTVELPVTKAEPAVDTVETTFDTTLPVGTEIEPTGDVGEPSRTLVAPVGNTIEPEVADNPVSTTNSGEITYADSVEPAPKPKPKTKAERKADQVTASASESRGARKVVTGEVSGTKSEFRPMTKADRKADRAAKTAISSESSSVRVDGFTQDSGSRGVTTIGSSESVGTVLLPAN